MRRSLLIIDDDEHVAAILQRILRGYDLVIAPSAEEGLARVGERAFDAVLCDLGLPGVSGTEFYARVADLRPGLERRVRFITGGATDESAIAFVAAHEDDVLHKPFEIDKLRRFVAELFEARSEAPNAPYQGAP